MASEKRTKELLKGLCDAVTAFDEEAVVALSKAALEEGVDAYDAITNGLAAGMERVGKLYESREYFVPQLLLCSDAFYAGLDILQPHIKKTEGVVKGRIVIGTIEGDTHDLGKNLVKTMFEAAGWTVYDLGKDVKLERFVEEQLRTDADIVAISALMSTTMLAMPKAIEMIRARNPSVAIVVGGAPLTRDIAKLYGADGYADSAGKAVQEAIDVISRRRKMQAK